VRITCETLSLYAPDAIVSSTSESNTPFHISLMAGPKTRIPVLVLGVLRFFWHFLGRRFSKLCFGIVMQIGERLRCLREYRNLSQDEVARRTGLVQRYISWIENGHAVPKLETLEKWVRAMQVPLYVFFYEENPPTMSARLARQPTDWASSGKGTRYLETLRHALGRLSQSDRELFISVVQRLGSKERKR